MRILDPRDPKGTGILGQPGMGKTKLMEWFFLCLARLNNIGGCVIDPHGDLFRNLVCHLAALLPSMPELAERVVIIDPVHPTWTVPINPLATRADLPEARVAGSLSDMCVKVWGVDSGQAPRMLRLMNFTFQALAELNLTLLEVPRWLLDVQWRESLLSGVAQDDVRSYFAWEFPKSPGAVRDIVTPLFNRLGRLIQDPDLRLMFSGPGRLNTRENMDRSRLVLVNGSKGLLGEGTVATLLAFLVADHQKAALSRADAVVRPPFVLLLDEFQNYTTSNVVDILSESRKYALKLVLAHQFLKQLDGDILNGVINATGTLITFRVGYEDAYRLAKEIFPSPDFLQTRQRTIRLHPRTLFQIRQKDQPFGWEGLALLLSNLEPREYVLRRRGPYQPIKQRTHDLPDPQMTPQLKELIEQLYEASGQRFGVRKSELRQQPAAPSAQPAMEPEMWPETIGWDASAVQPGGITSATNGRAT